MTHTLKAIFSAVVLTTAFTLSSPIQAEESKRTIGEMFDAFRADFENQKTRELVPFAPYDPGNLYFCFGWNDVTNECNLYLGSRESCDHLEPC